MLHGVQVVTVQVVTWSWSDQIRSDQRVCMTLSTDEPSQQVSQRHGKSTTTNHVTSWSVDVIRSTGYRHRLTRYVTSAEEQVVTAIVYVGLHAYVWSLGRRGFANSSSTNLSSVRNQVNEIIKLEGGMTQYIIQYSPEAVRYPCTCTSCIRRCLVSRACDWVMSALSAALLIFSSEFSLLFFRISVVRQHCDVLLVLIRNIGHRTLPKIWVSTFPYGA